MLSVPTTTRTIGDMFSPATGTTGAEPLREGEGSSIAREGESSTLGAGFTSTPPEGDMEGEV